jgi:hypothetical protein
MKEFRTALTVTPAPLPMQLRDKVLTQGSCFSTAIGQRLVAYKIRTLVNPFGVIYNPESIHKVLLYSIFNEPVPDHTFVKHHEIFVNYDFHSELSSPDKGDLSSKLANTIGASHYFLKDAEWILLTYGTAWVYHRSDTGEVVANCHKLPSAMFTRSLMSADAVSDSFRTFYDHLKKLNPKIRIILTVSPVRHLKDTLELNSVSKSILRVACHDIAATYDDVEYFPAYEIQLDDLRDYRFYKSDMLHPTAEAEDYIWEKFMERYFSAGVKDFVAKWKTILSALGHKPFHPHSSAHQQFLEETLKKIVDVKDLVNVDDEIAGITQLIQNNKK